MTTTDQLPGTRRKTVIDWVRQRARPLATVDPDSRLNDLDPLRELLGGATVVGLGRATHGTHELSTLSHRIFRWLVNNLGFRTLAVEEDWSTGIEIDAWLQTGHGDPRTLLGNALGHYQVGEIVELLSWMRARNERYPDDPVRFVGVDVSSVRALAYDAVTEYLRQVSPTLRDELDVHYSLLRPASGMSEHIAWYQGQPDKQRLIERARRAHDIVERAPDDNGKELALRHARAIVGFYEAHTGERMAVVEPRQAENTIWWHNHTGDRIAYWGGFTHTAVGHTRRVTFPGAEPDVHDNAGSHLRLHFGAAYQSVGLTFHHGSVSHEGSPLVLPTPSSNSTDAVLGQTGLDGYLLDLHGAASRAVRSSLQRPAQLRLVGPRYAPELDHDSHMTGGALTDWFDLLIHTQQVSPSHPLASHGRRRDADQAQE